MSWVWSNGTEQDEPARAAGARGAGISSREGRPTILVVDDDVSILDTVSEILTLEGYQVMKATGGEEALAIATRTRPSLILLDMRMPHTDGWAVARGLRERDISVPIIVMTAAENAKRWADEIGATGYLAKPFELTELLRAVEGE